MPTKDSRSSTRPHIRIDTDALVVRPAASTSAATSASSMVTSIAPAEVCTAAFPAMSSPVAVVVTVAISRVVGSWQIQATPVPSTAVTATPVPAIVSAAVVSASAVVIPSVVAATSVAAPAISIASAPALVHRRQLVKLFQLQHVQLIGAHELGHLIENLLWNINHCATISTSVGSKPHKPELLHF
eukprot:scaffold3159_cov393-Prasinococcus_capsulatus_cf.AAC.30